jgi:hypothetical protein
LKEKAQGSGLRAQGSGLRAQGSGLREKILITLGTLGTSNFRHFRYLVLGKNNSKFKIIL